MDLTTGCRCTINGINGTVVVSNEHGYPVFVKYDKDDRIFKLKGSEKIEAIRQKKGIV